MDSMASNDFRHLLLKRVIKKAVRYSSVFKKSTIEETIRLLTDIIMQVKITDYERQKILKEIVKQDSIVFSLCAQLIYHKLKQRTNKINKSLHCTILSIGCGGTGASERVIDYIIKRYASRDNLKFNVRWIGIEAFQDRAINSFFNKENFLKINPRNHLPYIQLIDTRNKKDDVTMLISNYAVHHIDFH